MKLKNVNLQPTALLAELLGTFVLAIVALAIGQPLIVGFVLVVLVLLFGVVSGAHLNPAVTFGLWSVRRLEMAKAPFYWAMQFAGAFGALVVMQLFKGGDFGISFASFGSFDAKILVAELIGAAILVFAITTLVERKSTETATSLGIGLALMAGLYIGGGLLAAAAQSTKVDPSATELPRVTKVEGITANPAIALAATERAEDSSMQSFSGTEQAAETPKTPPSRFTLETIFGTLVGGALGANLAMVTAGVNPFAKEVTKTVKKVTKKSKGKK